MAEPTNYDYEAIRTIRLGVGEGAPIAFNAGDLVPTDSVEGDDAWLIVGEDVRAREGRQITMPPRNASQARWASYAISKGEDADAAEGMSRADLIAKYGDEQTTAQPAAETAAPAPEGAPADDNAG